MNFSKNLVFLLTKVKVYLFLFHFGLNAFGQDVKLVVNKPFDINQIVSTESGPNGHIYSLSSDNKLALIRFDTVFESDKFRLIHKIVKVVDLSLWLGNEKSDTYIGFSSTSQDGRYISLSVVFSKPSKVKGDGTYSYSTSDSWSYLIDFKNEVIDFKFRHAKSTLFNSRFKGKDLIFTDMGNNSESVKTLSFNTLTGRTTILNERKLTSNEFRSISSMSCTNYGEFSCLDDVTGLKFSTKNDTLTIKKEDTKLLSHPFLDSARINFRRFSNGFIVYDQYLKLLFFIDLSDYKVVSSRCEMPRNFFNNCTAVTYDFLLNFSYGEALGYRIRSNKFQELNEKKSSQISNGNSAWTRGDLLLNKKRSNNLSLKYSSSDYMYEFDPKDRILNKLKMGSIFDSSSFIFPSNASSNFRLSTKAEKREISITDPSSTPVPKLILNGNEIGYAFDSDSIQQLSIDISKADDFLIMSQTAFPSLILMNPKGKVKWASFIKSPIRALKIDENDKSISTFSNNQLVDKWDSKKGNKYLSIYIDTTTLDWILWTPSGYYDCSTNGERLIGWSVSRGADSLPAYYPAGRFRDKFYRPNVIDSALKYCSEEIALKKIGLLEGKKAQKQITQNLPPIIQLESPGMNEFFSDTLLTIKYRVQNGTSHIHTIRVLLDGRPWKELKPERGVQSISLTIPAKDCSIGLVAVSASGESELSFSRLIWKGRKAEEESYKKANLYILAIGISKYKSEKLRLEYSAKDAGDFCNSLRGQSKGGLYEKVDIKLLTDSLATRENIESGLEWLEKNTTSRDVCMIFMAGHGENDANNSFYFLPWGADVERMKSTCIQYTIFKSSIESLPGKVLVFADACRSGNILGDLTRREADVERLSRELSSGNGGAIVFTSSSRKQASLESTLWNNGAFTKAVVEGLSGKADPYKQDYISVKSLDAYISYRVKELTDGRQHPNTIIPESIHDFAIAVKR